MVTRLVQSRAMSQIVSRVRAFLSIIVTSTILHTRDPVFYSLPIWYLPSLLPHMLPVNIGDTKQVEALLERLRKEPVRSEGSTDQIMKVILDYLFKVPEDPLDGMYHWFCLRADSVAREAATFLIRLFAYDSQRVDDWKARMKRIISSCCDCVGALQEVKRTSQRTCVHSCCLTGQRFDPCIRYLAVFPVKTRQTFMSSFSSWEVSLFLDGLAACHITPGGPMTSADLTLLNAPPALVYLALWNLDVLRDNRVLSIIAKYAPPAESPLLPPDPPPPGLFFLLFHENSLVRRWAKLQSMRCQHTPMFVDKFVGPYLAAFSAVEEALTMDKPTTIISSRLNFQFSQDTASIWSGFVSALRLLPREYLKSGKYTPVDLSHIVAGHLHDTGLRTYPLCALMSISPTYFPEFADVLRCHVFLLRRLHADLWLNEESDYPQVVLDSIKDNPYFTDLVRGLKSQDREPWLLLWFSDYLHSIWAWQIFDVVLVKMVDFLCEELQHERFQDARPAAMLVAADVGFYPRSPSRLTHSFDDSYFALPSLNPGARTIRHDASLFSIHWTSMWTVSSLSPFRGYTLARSGPRPVHHFGFFWLKY